MTLYDHPWYPNLGVTRPDPKTVNPYDSKAYTRTKEWILKNY